MKPEKVLVLCGDGINCERETALAFKSVGAECETVHINELSKRQKSFKDYQIFAFPGGFSFGDELGSGKILGHKLRNQLSDFVSELKVAGKPVIGICNGFQVLSQLGAFDRSEKRSLSLAENDSRKFLNRWVDLKIHSNKCLWTQGIETLSMPIRHKEGRAVLGESFEPSQICLSYEENVNGSTQKIAGVCNLEGNILGLMPHPEAAIRRNLYPAGVRDTSAENLMLFKNALIRSREL